MNVKFSFFLFLLLSLIACNEEISVGSSLLEDGSIDVEYNAAVPLEGYTRMADPLVMFRNSSNFSSSTHLVGTIDDPVFGRSYSELYMSADIVNNAFPSLDTLSIDSVVLVLPLDTIGQHGDESAVHDISVFQLLSELNVESMDTLLSSQQFDAEMMPLGQINTVVNHRDSVSVYVPSLDSVVGLPPQLRIPLDTLLWHEVASDTLISRDADAFSAFVRGLVVRSNPSQSSVFGVNLASNSSVAVEFYYSADDTTHFVYLIDAGIVRSCYFEHNFSGTEVESAVNDSSAINWYSQEMQGPEVVLDLKGALDFSDQVINRASIQLYALFEDDPVVNPIQLLRTSYINESARKSVILDYALESTTAINVYGGRPDTVQLNGNTLLSYTIDVTNHVNAIIADDVNSSEVIIDSPFRTQRAGRTIFFGSEHPDFPAQLRMVTSNP